MAKRRKKESKLEICAAQTIDYLMDNVLVIGNVLVQSVGVKISCVIDGRLEMVPMLHFTSLILFDVTSCE